MSRASRDFRNRVGKYELERALGEGSFGKVHLARDVETGEKRAIKVINKDRVVKDMMVAQIKREISTMKLAKHPNVVHLFEVMASKTDILCRSMSQEESSSTKSEVILIFKIFLCIIYSFI